MFLSAVLHRAEVDVFDQPDTTASDRMDLMDVIRTRRNLRRFKAAFAPESLLKEVLTTTRLALSACNSQSLKTMFVRYEQTKLRLAANGQNVTDVSIALDHLILAVHAAGLGTCRIASSKEHMLGEMLGSQRMCAWSR